LCIGHGGDSHAVVVLLVKVKYSVTGLVSIENDMIK
jgi:hypothetical protein